MSYLRCFPLLTGILNSPIPSIISIPCPISTNPCSLATFICSIASFLLPWYAVLHSTIVPFSLSTSGLIKSAFKYPLEPASPVETLIPIFPFKDTPNFS